MYTTDGYRIILDGKGPIAYADKTASKEEIELLVARANLFVQNELLINKVIEALINRHD